MDRKVKKLWIDALRSGKYRQGRAALRDAKDNYCCLGVLCDLYAQETNDGTWIREGEGVYFFHATDSTDQSMVLPLAVAKWASDGIGQFGQPNFSDVGSFRQDEQDCTLAEENDKGMSFDQIARILEEQF